MMMKAPDLYTRTDGVRGVRNHLFALPTVVCANQVAIQVASLYPALKLIEHQHGCAQIGADNEQTRDVLARLATHPNVYASMLLSLGCEGIVTHEVRSRARALRSSSVDVTVIQQAGGTLGAAQKLEQWYKEQVATREHSQRSPGEWSDVTIGLMQDGDATDADQLLIAPLMTALGGLGARIVITTSIAQGLARTGAAGAWTIAHMAYGIGNSSPVCAMAEGSTELETVTGLTSAGAHVILHLAAQPHLFASPLAPTIRLALSRPVYMLAQDAFDGLYENPVDLDETLALIGRVIAGQETVSEQLGMEEFGLFRIGPTV